MIDVAISTVNRPKNYLHTLMRLLRKDLAVRLVVGSPDYRYLDRYRKKKHIQVIEIELAEWEMVKNYSVIHRALWNYWRCCMYGVSSGPRRGLLILEDDVIPARGWEEWLQKTVSQIEVEYGGEYILALHTWFTELPKPVPGRYFNPYPAHVFGGTQAVYYPESVRTGFADYLKTHGVDSFRTAYDYLLREYLMRTGIPCFASAPCLFQHVGTVSTGLSMKFAKAGFFRRDLRKGNRKP